MTTPTTYIDQITDAFRALQEGLAGLEASVLNWSGALVEHHHTAPVQETPAVEDAPATPTPIAAVEAEEAADESDSFPYSFEDVRQILGTLTKDGHKLAVQEALKEHGARRLSDIDPVKYEALIDAARAKAAA